MADGDLDQSEFGIAFTFTRPVPAYYRDANGITLVAPIDVPRFDHDPVGKPLGLLIEGATYFGQADRPLLDPLMLPEDITGQETTVFHATVDVAGEITRSAWYSRNAPATINALLSGAGHHIEIGVILGFREKKGASDRTGYVRYRGHSWSLATLLSAGSGAVLADDAGRPLIGG